MNRALCVTLSTFGLCLFVASAHAIATKTLITETGTSGEDFGNSVADAGDVNGDGYPDFIVGAERWGTTRGRAFLFFGGPDVDAVPDLSLVAPGPGQYFGASVSGAGDVNGDGYDDLIVGAWAVDSVAHDAGRAYLFHGGPVPDSIPDLIIAGASAEDRLGISVSGAGDVNGDGFADVIVGAEQWSAGGGFGVGQAYVFYGGAAMDTTADLTLTGQLLDSRFGTAVSRAGDVNGDGYDDVIVGAEGYFFNTGRAYLYYGGPSPDAVADLTFDALTSGDRFGAAVSGGGDVNLDGYDDVVVGAWLGGPSSEGQAIVYYGGAVPDNTADVTLTGEAASDQFGGNVSVTGDVNRDGYDDIIIGAQLNDAAASNAGRAYVFFGGPAVDMVADIVFSGETDSDLFGSAVSGGGDITGDGFPDLIVGARDYNDAGRAYVFDISRFHLVSPNGGETWPVGSSQSISWLGNDPADLWLSVDGGFTYEQMHSDVGGGAENTVPVLVPHVPTKFAVVKVTQADFVGQYSAQSTTLSPGEDQSDAMFTIESSVALLAFTIAARPGGGAELAWASEPALGPQGISGYRLYRRGASGSEQQIGPSIIAANRYIDDTGTQGSTYRLTAVNGLGEELSLGDRMLAPSVPLAAWPQPYRGGVLNVSFAAGNAFGGGAGQVDVSLYDTAGRRIRTLASGAFAPGSHTTSWDGRDKEGRRVPGGMYFLNLNVEGQTRQMKVVVAP